MSLYVCNGGPVCPDAYGCGQDGVCRRAKGTFSLENDANGYLWPTAFRAGDFDGDGNGDLLLLGATDSFGNRPARALFSEGFSLQTGLTLLPTEIANPAIGAGAGDGVSRDISFADFEGVALLRTSEDRTADFKVFPTITLMDDRHVRICMAEALPKRSGDELVILSENRNGLAELKGVEFGKQPVKLATVPGGEHALADERSFFAARFAKLAPCDQVVLGYRDATEVHVFMTCRSVGGMFDWNVGGALESIALQPEAKIDRGVFSADVDIDGHLDLVIGAGGRTYVAYGAGDGQFTSQKTGGTLNEAAPYLLPVLAGGAQGFPLAVADLNADNLVDFVMPTGIVISRDTDYEFAYKNFGAPWADAVVANLNGNDLPDVVARVDGALDIQFFNNAGDGVFGGATLPTEGPPAHLTVGDFDGDLLQDLVFSGKIAEEGAVSDHLVFSFGSPYGPPTFPIATGDVGELGQIVTGRVAGPAGIDPMAEIAVVVEGKEEEDEGNAEAVDSIALLPGRASRAIFSTIPLRVGSAPHVPVSLAFGHFGDSTPDIVALGANSADGRLSLFRIETFADAGIVVPESSDPLPANFITADTSKAINLRYGATVIAVDLNNDGHDEAVVVGAYTDWDHGAFAIAEHNLATLKFSVVDAHVFEGQVTSDSVLFADDLDGDGKKDLVLTTGTLAVPSDLIVVWGDELGTAPDFNQALERIRLDGLGVRAVAALRAPQGKGKMLLASTTNATYLLELTAGRSWTPVVTKIGSARAFAVIDFDHDGVEDLAVQSEGGLELYRSDPK